MLLEYGQSQPDDIKFERISIRDGMSQSYTTAIFQDSKGLMWFGTQDGLNMYDGYEFVKFYHNPNNSNSLADNYVHTIYEDTLGNLWIGTDNGLSKLNPKTYHFTNFNQAQDHGSGLTNNSIRDIFPYSSTQLWIATAGGGINRINTIDGEIITDNSTINGISSKYVNCITRDTKNNIWIGTEDMGLYQYNTTKNSITNFQHNDLIYNSMANDLIWAITCDNKDNVWIGTNDGLSILYHQNIDSAIFINHMYEPGLPTIGNNVVTCIYQDFKNILWVGTEGGGLGLVNQSSRRVSFHNYTNMNYLNYSLSDDRVQQIFEDNTGTIWIGTNNGLNKFDPTKQSFNHYHNIPFEDNSLNDNTIWSVHEDSKDVIWVGTRQGLNSFKPDLNQYISYTNISKSSVFKNNKSIFSVHENSSNDVYIGCINGLYKINFTKDRNVKSFKRILYSDDYQDEDQMNRVYNIFEDKAKNLWIGTKNGLSKLDPETGEYIYFTSEPGNSRSISGNTIRSIHQDNSGDMWFGTESGFSHLIQKQDTVYFVNYYHDIKNPESLSNNMVLSIWEDNGILWLGTYGGGLNKFNPKTEKFIHYSEQQGLSNAVIYGVLGDDKGNLWMSTNRGLSKFNIEKEFFNNFGEADGLQSDEFNIGAYHKSESGQLFFGGINGLNSFYSYDITSNSQPPTIILTGININNRKLDTKALGNGIENVTYLNNLYLNYKQDNVTFFFSALHYSYPKRNKYAYKLTGENDDWIEIGNKREATYTNLAPGDYTFIVKATNCDGIWSESVASIKLYISPPFWLTWWFIISSTLLATLGVVLGLRARVKIIQDQKNRLELEVMQRTADVVRQKEKIESQNAQLESEKDKSEKLLLNILPSETVEELKTKGKTKPRSYRTVSVMFTDFKNFTKISETMRPKDLVEELDSYFVKYDEIIEEHNVEKIKTIGDSYMCAGGIPIRNKSNPIDVVLAGLKIQQYMIQRKASHGDLAWEVRLGIHTGELIAGVIGFKRFAYDIWGNTVNVANRMELTGEPGKVNISENTYQHINTFFECTDRGEVQTKNMGMLKMYFVDRIVPELSEDADGTTPNKMFWEYVDLKLYSSINYRKAEKYIIKVLEKGLSDELSYHNIRHTKDVCDAVETIAYHENVRGEELFLLKTAALYHDAGFVKEYFNNEPVGASMAREILPKYGYSEEQIVVIERLILATKVPQQPADTLEEIICDADLDYLGRDDFDEIADELRKEFIAHKVVADDKAWDELQIKFLSSHQYFTGFSKDNRQEVKLKHLSRVKERLRKDNY